MFDAELYNPIYNYGMLFVAIITLIVYAGGEKYTTGYNQVGIWVATITMVTFLGTRPVSGVFVDMSTYSKNYQSVAAYGTSMYPDWLFNAMVNLMAPYFPEIVYFIAVAVIYTVPLTMAASRRHAKWGLAVVLAFYGSFSFFAYGTNGLRNGMATSLLVAAFAWCDKPLLMALMMVAATGMHNSVLVPIAAFMATWVWSRPWTYALLWLTALVFVTATGSRTSDIMMAFLPSSGDDLRLETYLTGIGNDRGGYRPDFILYSIVPIVISYLTASRATKAERFYQRLLCTYLAANTFWLLTMYAAFSNRFAYLSWFLMPWLIVYPLVPKSAPQGAPEGASRVGLLGVAILVHFAFTFLMLMYIYANRPI